MSRLSSTFGPSKAAWGRIPIHIGKLKSLKQDNIKQGREGCADRAVGKLGDGYTEEEYRRLCSGMFEMEDQLGIWLRTCLDIQLLHAVVLRSETNLFPCIGWAERRTLETGNTDYTGILRHKDPVVCPLASLAFYLLWRFDIDNVMWLLGLQMRKAFQRNSRLPREFMRVIAGFSRPPGNYHLRRATVKPPTALKSQVWPWVDSFAEGGLDDCVAGKEFLDLLDWLRDILLQDAPVLQRQFPLFPLWRHPIFCHPDWRCFADNVLVAHNTADEPINMRIRKVLPDLEETVCSTREAVLFQVDLHIPEQLLTVPWRVISQDAFNSYLDEQTALPSRPLRAQPPAVPPSSSSSTAIPPSSSSSIATTARPSLIPLTAGGWPVQPYDPSVTTVADARKEWQDWAWVLPSGIKRDSMRRGLGVMNSA
ncbi:hypothetical protein V8E54_001228 [Elaphomyces granulatus]